MALITLQNVQLTNGSATAVVPNGQNLSNVNASYIMLVNGFDVPVAISSGTDNDGTNSTLTLTVAWSGASGSYLVALWISDLRLSNLADAVEANNASYNSWFNQMNAWLNNLGSIMVVGPDGQTEVDTLRQITLNVNNLENRADNFFRSINFSQLSHPRFSLGTTEHEPNVVSGAVTTSRTTNASFRDIYGDVRNAAANIPRFEKGGRLIEGSGTNLLLWSSDFNNAVWFKGSGATINTDSTTAPDNTLTADTLQASTGNEFVEQAVSNTITGSFTFSIWLKAPSNTTVRIRVKNISNTDIETSDVGVTTEWQRFEVSFSDSVGENILGAVIAQSTGNIDMWRGQLENSAFSTSSISTQGTSSTRAADIVSAPTLNNIPNTSEPFSIFSVFNLRRIPSTQSFVYRISDGTTTVALELSSSGALRFQIGGVNVGSNLTVSDLGNIAVATVFDGINAILYINGAERTRTAVNSQKINPSTASFYIGTHSSFSFLNSTILTLDAHDFALNLDEVTFMSGG